MTRESIKRWAFERGALLALVVLVVYVVLAPTTIVDSDNAELATLGAIGGRAHPSGYPAYVLYLRAMSWLPGANPAHAAAIATCVLGALAVWTMHAVSRAWGARPLAATIACAIYAGSPVVLRMHTEAEVFAGNALVVALVLWLASAEGPLRGVRRGALLGLVAGLGLANHLTCSLVAPIGILGVVRAIREASSKPVAALGSLGGLVVGLSAYAYLFIADSPVSFGRVEGIGDILGFILREDYGGPVAFVPGENPVRAMDSLVGLVETLGRGWLWLPATAGVTMLGVRIARPRGETRWAWALLAVCFVVAGPLLATRFNIPPEGFGLYVVQRFHLLPLLLLAIPVATAVDWLGAKFRIAGAGAAVGTALAIIGFAVLIVIAVPRLRAVHSPAMERGIANLLSPLPERAVALVNSEDLCLGAEYMQHARGVRSDVDVVCWVLTSRDWYRERMAARGIPLEPFQPLAPAKQADAILATGRALYIDRTQHAILRERTAYPHGVLMRVLPQNGAQPTLHEVLELNERAFRSFDLDYEYPGTDDDFATGAHQRYATTWIILARQLEAAGDPNAAKQALDIARSLAPGGQLTK